MLSDDQLRHYLRDLKADNVERTAGIAEKDKFGQAICAFGNDLPNRGETGVLFVGVRDSGDCANPIIDERLIQTLAGLRDGGGRAAADGEAALGSFTVRPATDFRRIHSRPEFAAFP